MFKKKEIKCKKTYVLRNCKELHNLGWYLDKKIGKVNNGKSSPSSWVESMCLFVVYKPFDNLTLMSLPWWIASYWHIVMLWGSFVNCKMYCD
jgi:hypothetical protein